MVQDVDRRMGIAVMLAVAGLIVLMITVTSALLGPSIMPDEDGAAAAATYPWVRPFGLTVGAAVSVGLLWGAWRVLTRREATAGEQAGGIGPIGAISP